eukprot:6259776-Prymnesium_polylepis.1
MGHRPSCVPVVLRYTIYDAGLRPATTRGPLLHAAHPGATHRRTADAQLVDLLSTRSPPPSAVGA